MQFCMGVLFGAAITISVLWVAHKLFVIDDKPVSYAGLDEVPVWRPDGEEQQVAGTGAVPAELGLRRLVSR